MLRCVERDRRIDGFEGRGREAVVNGDRALGKIHRARGSNVPAANVCVPLTNVSVRPRS